MAMTDPFSILILFSATIILGYIGSLIFDKTKIPDVVWLLFFGLLVGPILKFIDVAMFVAISPLLVSLALIIILFDAGLNMNFYQMIKQFARSTILSILGIILSMGVIGIVSVTLFGFNWINGLLLGAIVGGTSSPIVITIMSELKIRENVKTILSLESILTDPICIVTSIALLDIITTQQTSNILNTIISSFSIGIVLGLLFGLAWLLVLDKLKRLPFDYMLTVAILFLSYVTIESLGGSGAIGMLFFGLTLANGPLFTRFLKFKKGISMRPFIKDFHKEISFFIRSFFFVYLGLIATINVTYVLYGIALTVILLVLRLVVIEIMSYKQRFTSIEKNIMRIMTPKGLAAAVLAQMTIQFAIPNAEFISNVVFVIILVSVIYSSIAIKFIYKPEIKGEKYIPPKTLSKGKKHLSIKEIK
ncbi:MAG: cation:proton antiporter [Candidatus Aenigmarchaeota archaeon]|nr:cation:proton antiporter [Candidatus Aenigmarchaeota archaeon]